jgi:hypothetical protein
MLSLGMNMEADLGIDSINRVEIMAGMQDEFPGLPNINPEKLAELCTLQEVVDYIRNNGSSELDHQIDDEPLPAHNIKRYTVRLKPLPEPDYAEISLPAGHVCLLTDDGSEASIGLAERLQARGWSPVVLTFPGYIVPSTADWPAEINRVTLADMSEGQMQQVLTTITNQYGPVGAFIHVGPTRQTAQSNGVYFAEAEKALAKQIFLMAKYLKPSLTSAFLTVSRLDGGLGTSMNGSFSAVDGSLFGLTKTLYQEWPAVFCRAIDLSPALDTEQVVSSIMAELHDPNRVVVEVGYGPDGRVTLVEEGNKK